MDNKNAKNTTSNDSLKNCHINCPRTEPIAFRTPTSFERFSERAVLKFIKFMHASNKTKQPIIENNQTDSILPPAFPVLSQSANRCQRLMGFKNALSSISAT